MSHSPTIVHAATAAAPGGIDPLTIGLVLLLAVMVIFMFRNSRKRKRDAEQLQNKFVPGAEVMTQHGIYGTLISIDDEKNEAIIETTPGTRLRVHRQTISRVIDPVEAEEDVIEEPSGSEFAAASHELNQDHAIPAGDPQYGERVGEGVDEKPKRAPRKKAAE
ncbi:MAG: preprotein translocase subunit YajC [Actinomycetota bacterium]|nr:preprotein translocase subunit YajC [Actinomycetota bacterium]